jgi:hypothetical protein
VNVHFLPRSPNSHKNSISNSSRLKMSQAIGTASRNTAPVGPKSTAQANDYTSRSHQVTTLGQRGKHSTYQDTPWAHPLGVSPRIFKDFLKKSCLENIHNECTTTKGGDRLRWKEVKMWLLKRKSNQQKHWSTERGDVQLRTICLN